MTTYTGEVTAPFKALLLALAILVSSTACSGFELHPDKEPARAYSFEFAGWFYPSNGIGIDVGPLRQRLLASADEASMRQQLRDMADAQSTLNAQFRAAAPPEEWAEFHAGIIEATMRYDAGVARVKDVSSRTPFVDLLDLFDTEQQRLLQTVIGCYTHTKLCDEAIAP